MWTLELVDIVDRDDKVIEIKPRDQIWADEITRTSACFVVDKEGSVLIAQRDATKKSAPNIWSVAVAETVQAWENYLDAIIRGAFEEIQLSVTHKDLVPTKKKFSENNNTFRQTYFIVCTDEQKISLIPKEWEVQAIQWVSPVELKEMIQKNRSLYSKSLPKALDYREKYNEDIIAVLEAKNTQ